MNNSWLSKLDSIPSLSIILPAYQAGEILEAKLPGLLTYLRGLDIPFEIIVCDDTGQGGEQLTRDIATRLDCGYCAHAKNRGKGAAVRTGMLAASGEYRMFTDADIPFEMTAITQALHALIVEDADVVVGDRRLLTSNYFNGISRTRRMGSYAFSQFARFFFGDERFDTQCGLKAFRGDVAESLFLRSKVNRFAMDVEILFLAMQLNYRICKIPVRLRNSGTSSVKFIRDGLFMLRDLVSVPLFHLAGRYNVD